MGTLDTQEKADALCTVIALGFIIHSKSINPQNTYIVYQENPNDDSEYQQHLKLQKKLARLANVKDLFALEIQSPNDKPRHPIILAQTKHSAVQGDIAAELLPLFQRLEREVNEFEKKEAAGIPLRGAYIGGLLTVESAELLDPSILYCYDPRHREFPPDQLGETQRRQVETSFRNAEAVTKTVEQFLGSVFPKGRTMTSDRALLRQSDNRPLSADMSDKPTGSQLFASVHGMTQSIVHYYANGDNAKVNIELALSRDTRKVASCIPCSIFMWANGTPASATHFGRGDNWNFPSYVLRQIKNCSDAGRLEPPCVQNWVACIKEAYMIGKTCFTEYSASWDSKGVNYALNLRLEEIPLMFLEALTFESSFLSKMLRTLECMPKESVQL